MAELNQTSLQTDYAGLTLWDLRSDVDDLNLAGFENQIQVKLEKESDHDSVRTRDNGLDQQIPELAIKKEPSLSRSKDKLLDCQSVFNLNESRNGFVDESQIDDEGWVVDEHERVSHGRREESERDGSTVRKRPLEDSNLEGSGIRKIINLADCGLGDVADQRDKKKRRKHGIITTTSSKEIGLQNPNATSDSKFSCSSVGQIGSMSLHVHQQQLNGINKRQRTSDVDIGSTNKANQTGNHFRNILDEAVKMADEAILNRVSSGSAPRQHVCKSLYSQAKTVDPMVSSQGKSKDTCLDKTTKTNIITNEGKRDDACINDTMKTMGPDHGKCGDHGTTKSNGSDVKQKPRPSEKARILRRFQPKDKPSNGDGRTFVALIPVGGPNSKTSESKVHRAKKDEVKRRSNRIIRKLLPKPSEAEFKEAQMAQPDHLIGGPSKFHQIAPPVAKSVSHPTVPNYQLLKEPSKFRNIAPKPSGPQSIVVPVFEIVPVKMQAENSMPVKPKTSSRRKQNPLSMQTGGENWRLEESEVIVEESLEDEENVKRKQNVRNFVLDSDEEEEDEEDDDDDEEGDDDEEDQNIDFIWEEELEGVKVEVVDDDDGEKVGAEEERKEWPFIKYEVHTD